MTILAKWAKHTAIVFAFLLASGFLAALWRGLDLWERTVQGDAVRVQIEMERHQVWQRMVQQGMMGPAELTAQGQAVERDVLQQAGRVPESFEVPASVGAGGAPQ
ncbi:MAG: hypothetical protein PF961_10590 [Planctomycetota bacterium]|jgi:hypothetical protein|nr:hypothetical protein [Planctomycetota bacterium]